MSNEVSPDQMQARIQQARREAENLKDRIKRKKDELSDGTRKYTALLKSFILPPRLLMRSGYYRMLMDESSLRYRQEFARSPPKEPDDEDSENIEGTSRKNLCNALVHRSKTFSISVAGWKAYYLGCLHNQQGSRHPSAILMGHDLCLCPKW
jgi:hypothetical protein